MLTIISGTHRKGSSTRRVAQVYHELALSQFDRVELIDLQDLPTDFIFNNSVFGNPNPALEAILEGQLKPAKHLAFVMPEYNGGIPGVLKAFIDSFAQETWYFKKVAMVGVASGRAGNLRGMDDLTNYMNYMKSVVLPNKIPLSGIYNLWSADGNSLDEKSTDLLKTQLQQLALL